MLQHSGNRRDQPLLPSVSTAKAFSMYTDQPQTGSPVVFQGKILAATALLGKLLHAPHTTGTAGVTSIFLNRTGIFKAPHLPSCSFPRSPQSYFGASVVGINVIRSAHPMQGPSQGIQAGFSLPRTLHIKGLPCSQGSSLP